MLSFSPSFSSFFPYQQHRFLATGSVNLHHCIDGSIHDVNIDLVPSGRLQISLQFTDSSPLFGLSLVDVCCREVSVMHVWVSFALYVFDCMPIQCRYTILENDLFVYSRICDVFLCRHIHVTIVIYIWATFSFFLLLFIKSQSG